MKMLLHVVVLFMLFRGGVSGADSISTNSGDGTRGVHLSNLTNARNMASLRLNTSATFESLKINDMVAFLVGNNEYGLQANVLGFGALQQCVNDTRLLSRVLAVCCKVPAKNINIANNLTADQFRAAFRRVVAKLKKGQSFFFSFSGHGDAEGSLVFCDGRKVGAAELRAIINTFQNDTIMLLDACYSGNNEGPLDRRENTAYKDNSIRIYASLAHMTAKEISYQGLFVREFFSRIEPFYQTVLGLSDLSGNGYFTSFIGYFFATYQFRKNENISVFDMLNFISNKGKQYVEYLAMRGNGDRSAATESSFRLDQQPKVFPLETKVRYRDPNHQFLMIHHFIRSTDLSLELLTAPLYGINTVFRDTVTGSLTLKFAYNPQTVPGFSIGLETGYMFARRDENTDLGYQGIDLRMIPILATAAYRLSPGNGRFGLSFEAGAGVSVGIWNFHEYKVGGTTILYPESRNTANFTFLSGIGFSWEFSDNLSLNLGVQLLGIYLARDELYKSLRFPLSFRYKL